MTESATKLKWPIESNRDTIAAELDNVQLPSKLKRALWAILQIQWPADKPADWKPGHSLVPISLPTLASALGYKSENTVREVPFLLHGLGLIHWVKGIDGKPHLISINWDRLFGVDATPPLQNNPREIEGVQFEPLQKLQGCNPTPLQKDTPSKSELQGCNHEFMAVLTRIAVALESIAAKLPEPVNSQEKQTIVTPESAVPTRPETVSNTPPQNHTPSKLQGCNFAGVQIEPPQFEGVPSMNHIMKEFNSIMNDGGKPVPQQPRKHTGTGGNNWAFPEPYYQITKEHLESTAHLNRMLEHAISIGKWPAGQTHREDWFKIAGKAATRNSPGPYFRSCIQNYRTGGRPQANVTATAPPVRKSIAEMSEQECKALLKGDEWALREWCEAKSKGLDPLANISVRAGIQRALKGPKPEVAR